MISIVPYGDTALLINFEQRIDRLIHAQVLAVQDALTGVPGIRYMIPAYCSLTVVFDPALTSYPVLYGNLEGVVRRIETQSSLLDTGGLQTVRRTPQHLIPVCYDPEFSPDLDEVSVQTGKTIDEIIEVHLNTEFYVYMLGFMPGFAYMGDMPEEFKCRRRETPRTRVPAGSVGLALRQTAIYPFESPGGWQIIGRTPVKIFDPSRAIASIFKAGDTVHFRRISKAEFQDFR